MSELLQAALTKRYQHSTIISAAHRLETIIDYDMILVLRNDDKVIEYRRPSDLIENRGHFAKMSEDAGSAMSAELKMRAAKGKVKDFFFWCFVSLDR